MFSRRQVRYAKRDAAAAKVSNDAEMFDRNALRVKDKQAQLEDYARSVGLPADLARAQVVGYNRSVASSVVWGARRQKLLNEAKFESGIVGTLSWGSKTIDVSSLSVDLPHIHAKHPSVTEVDARSYIENAIVTITRNGGLWQNYYSLNGAAYVNMAIGEIRTAFTADEYDETTKKMMEVMLKNELPFN